MKCVSFTRHCLQSLFGAPLTWEIVGLKTESQGILHPHPDQVNFVPEIEVWKVIRENVCVRRLSLFRISVFCKFGGSLSVWNVDAIVGIHVWYWQEKEQGRTAKWILYIRWFTFCFDTIKFPVWNPYTHSGLVDDNCEALRFSYCCNVLLCTWTFT